MSVNSTRHRQNSTTANTSRKPSPAIWGDCPWEELNDPRSEIDGITFFDDFTDGLEVPFATGALQTTSGALGRYKAFSVTAGVWGPDNMPHSTTAAVFGGVISGLCDSNNDQAALGTYVCPFLLTTTQNSKLWFEARVAKTSIATNMGQFFVGLGETQVLGTTGYTASVPLADTDTNATTLAMLGWQRQEDGLGVLNTVYADHASPFTNVQASANTTLAANTWIKLGFRVDMASANACVRFFADNVETTTPMTRATLLATTFLDVSNLGPLIAFYADSAGTADYTYLDWWRCAQTLN